MLLLLLLLPLSPPPLSSSSSLFPAPSSIFFPGKCSFYFGIELRGSFCACVLQLRRCKLSFPRLQPRLGGGSGAVESLRSSGASAAQQASGLKEVIVKYVWTESLLGPCILEILDSSEPLSQAAHLRFLDGTCPFQPLSLEAFI